MTNQVATEEYFRLKVTQLLEALKKGGFKEAVASQANLIVSKAIATGDTVVNLDVKAVNQATPTQGEIYLQNQDVFLAQKIAYYRKSTGADTGQSYFRTSDLPEDLQGNTVVENLYLGTLAFIQNRTITASLLSLQEFVKRKNMSVIEDSSVGGVPKSGFSDFDIEECAKVLMPFWLLSGQRDNSIQIQYQQPLNTTTQENATRIYVNIKGVLIPNAAQALGNLDLGL